MKTMSTSVRLPIISGLIHWSQLYLNDAGWSHFRANQSIPPSKTNGVAFSCTGAFCTACWKFFQGELWVHIELTSVVPSLKNKQTKTNKEKRNKWKKRILWLFGRDGYRSRVRVHSSGLWWAEARRQKRRWKAVLPYGAHWELDRFFSYMSIVLNFRSLKTAVQSSQTSPVLGNIGLKKSHIQFACSLSETSHFLLLALYHSAEKN